MKFAFALTVTFLSFIGLAHSYTPEQVQRGGYLVTVAGCADCHTPMKMGPEGPVPDLERNLSGHPEFLKIHSLPQVEMPWMMVAAVTGTAFAGPWGVSFAANLTPDNETGTGLWTEQNFIDTIRTGRHFGVGRPILPPMPIPAIRNATDEDLKAIFAYLRTIPAIKNRVQEPLEP